MTFTKADINDLKLNLAWQEIASRVAKMFEQANNDIEKPEPFEHGKAVGERKICMTILGLPEELMRVAENKGDPTTKLR